MSADRYDVDMHDDGTFIITNLNGHRFIVDANCVDIRSRAIRQQARDIAALKDALADEVTANEAFRKAGGARDDEDMPTFCARLIAESEIGRQWNADSSLAKWFPLTAERVEQDAQEIAKLRADLAAAVALIAARDETIAELELRLRISRQSNKELREAAEQAEARLAAIESGE